MAEHFPAPWHVDPLTASIYASDVPKGPARVADMRGWGYLTGRGHGALALSEDEAIDIQRANAVFLVKAVNSHGALVKALADVRQELWVDYCLHMGRTDTDPRPFAAKPHIRTIDDALSKLAGVA